jgi:putative thioredoxin
MNIDDHPTIAGQLGIQSIPAVIAFRDGQPVDGFMGAQPDSKIKEFIDRVAGPGGPGDQIAEALAVAAEALGQGDRQGAADVLAQILDFEPGNPAAVAMMGGMLVDAGDLAAAKALLETVPADKAKGEDIAGLAARITLAEEVAAIGDKGELLRRLDSDPKDHQARYDLAMILNAENDRTGAADNLLAIMKGDRAWQDDGARRQLLKFFEAWGMTDEATLSARRKLSSLLFS